MDQLVWNSSKVSCFNDRVCDWICVFSTLLMFFAHFLTHLLCPRPLKFNCPLVKGFLMKMMTMQRVTLATIMTAWK